MVIHNRDHVLRLIERLGRLLRQVPGRLDDPLEDLVDVESEVEEIASQAGFDLGLAAHLIPESLTMMIAPFGEPDPGRCRLLAELLYLDGRRTEGRGDTVGARARFSRSLHLHRMAAAGEPIDTELPDAAERIEALEEWLADVGDKRP
jgi:hypothetical protein